MKKQPVKSNFKHFLGVLPILVLLLLATTSRSAANILPIRNQTIVVKKNVLQSMQYFTDKGQRLSGPQPQGASTTVLDTYSSEPLCAASPYLDRKYLGTAWNAADPGGTGPLLVDSIRVFVNPQVTQHYVGVRAWVQPYTSWNGGSASPVFSGPVGFTGIPLGAQDYTAGGLYGYTITYSTPISFPNLTNLGIVVNFDGDTGSGYADTNDLPPLICYGGTVATGSVPTISPSPYYFGWYQDTANHGGWNFNTSDNWWFLGDSTKNSNALQLQIMGHRTPFTVTSASALMNGSSGPINLTYPASATGTGSFSGTGYGTVTYNWEYRFAGTTTWNPWVSGLTTPMTNGSASIPASIIGTILTGTWEFRATSTSPSSVSSNIIAVNVSATASTPNQPSGSTADAINTSYTYTTGGSTCPDPTNPVEYQFDWGDATQSTWSQSTSASHSWPTHGDYFIKAHARCIYSPANVSSWSTSLDINIGWIISGNAGVAGATLSYADGTPKTATADGSGNYTFPVSFHWSGAVTPSKISYAFTPTYRTYINVMADQPGQDYTATPVATFADVPTTHWAWNYIERVYHAGITGGCGNSPLIYCPDNYVTRAQMAIFLERGMRGSSYIPPAATGTVFGDVPISYWDAAWIEKLAADGITGGCGGGNYCPGSAVTRAQMAIFLLRAEHGSSYTPPAATGTVFGDIPISYWDAAWIEKLYAEGITGGCGGGNYCPSNPVTRAEMAVFLVRTFNLP